MFAVIRTGGKQYRVAADEKITVMALAGNPGDKVSFEDVLLAGAEDSAQVAPKMVVHGEIVAQTRSPKTISFKKRRRKNSKRKRGHRQDLTIVRITEIAG